MADGRPQVPFWYALSEPRRNELRQMGTPRVYQPETVIVREGDQADFAIIVLDGCVKVSTHDNRGYQAILGLRNGGDLVGELAVVDGDYRSATLTTLTVVEALILPAGSFRNFLRQRPDAAEVLHRTVSGRLREADRYRSAAGSQTVPQRLAGLLLLLGTKYGEKVDNGGVLIDLPLSQEELAGMIATSQRTLGRILEQWRQQKLIVTGRRSVLLLSVEDLSRLLAR